VPEQFRILLDQNIPRHISAWLRRLRPEWDVTHAAEIGLSGVDDRTLFGWAQERRAVIVTFDEDFADRRSFPVGDHHGIVRLRVWPTTIEETQHAIERLLAEVTVDELTGALVIIDRSHIRVRPGY
jgi:predicted nuclease of predicted toxin-antitoxin system